MDEIPNANQILKQMLRINGLLFLLTLQSRLSGGDIVVSRQADPEEPFVVAEIQVCLATVV